MVAAENKRWSKPFEEVKPSVNVRLNWLCFVAAALCAGAESGCVAKVAEVNTRLRIVAVAKFKDRLHRSPVSVNPV
jgi:hypothetical protein